MANCVIKVGSYQNKFDLLSNLVSSRWLLKLCNSRHMYVEVRITQTEFTYLSITLQPICINETHLITELTGGCLLIYDSVIWCMNTRVMEVYMPLIYSAAVFCPEDGGSMFQSFATHIVS
jgi:hypothetical protein